MKKVWAKLCIVLASALLICACKVVGLGEAVDTLPPSVTITLPEADSKIRDSFVMSGEWSDDLSVSKITIVLNNLNTGNEYGPFEAVKNGEKETEGTWSCSITPIEDGVRKIPDGVYTATITAYDSYEHTGTITQTFGIDNTCPILTISSPSTTADIGTAGITLASFGKIFDIKGEYSDDSGVDAIEVAFFDENGDAIDGATTSLKVKGTTIDDSVAVWGAADGLYEKIYGNNQSAGTKSFYCTITIYDTARKVPAEAGDKGNACEYFFLADEITENYFSNDDAGNFKAKEAYSILSGEIDAADLSQYYQAWYDDIESLKKNRASFTINPANNPTFSVTGYSSFVPGAADVSAKELDKMIDGVGLYEFKDKSQISITVSPGLDGYGLKSNSLKVHFVEADAGGNVLKKADGTYVNDVVLRNVEVTPIGSSYTLEASIKADTYNGITIGNYYVIQIEGTDTKGNVVSNGGNVFAIKYMPANTTAPNVKITKLNGEENVSSISIKGSDSISIEGSLSYFPDVLVLNAYIGNPDEDDSTLLYSSEEIVEQAVTVADGAYGFAVDAPVLNDQKKSTKYAITIPNSKILEAVSLGASGSVSFEVFIEAQLKNANVEGSAYVQTTIDRDAPKFEEDYTVTPEVEVETLGTVVKYVNGTVKLEVGVSDNVTMNPAVKYSLDGGATWSSEVATRKLTLNLDTTRKALADPSAPAALVPFNGDWTIKFKATDKVGNVGEKEVTLKVDQKTDAPEIVLSNAVSTIDSVDGESNSINENGDNIFGSTSNNVILGSITDDDLIASVVYEYQEGDVWNPDLPIDGAHKTVINNINKRTYSMKYTVPSTEGNYVLRITVKDTAQDNTKYNTTVMGPFLIAVDNGAPEITFKTASCAYQAAKDKFNIEGTINDKKAKIEVFECDENGKILAGSTGELVKDFTDETLNWSHEESTGTDTKYLSFKATDIYGQSSSKTFSYLIDSNPPKITITTLGGEDYDKVEEAKKDEKLRNVRFASMSSLFTVKGDVEDEGSSNLEDNIYYKVSATEPEKIEKEGKHYYKLDNSWSKAVITTSVDNSHHWVANVDMSDTTKFVDGDSYFLYVAAKDNAANVSLIEENATCNIFKLTLDSTPPVIKLIEHTTNGANELVITAYVADGESAVGGVSLILNQSNSSIVGAKDGTKTDFAGDTTEYLVYKFVVGPQFLSDGKNTYNVKAFDIAGNSSTYGSDGEIDNSAPFINLVNPLVNNVRQGDFYFTNKDVVINYTVTATGNYIGDFTRQENSGTAATVTNGKYYTDSTKNTESTDVKTNRVYVGKVTLGKGSSSAKYEQKFEATNAYGAKTSDTFKYIVDLDAPTISNIAFSSNKQADTSYFDATKTLQISGTAVDGQADSNMELQSGLDEVQYALVNGKTNTVPDVDSIVWEDTTGKSEWKIKLNLTTEGDYTVFIRAKDNVGNTTVYENPIHLIADLNEPEVEITKVNGGSVGNALAEYYNGEAGESGTEGYVTIEGKVNETYLKKFSVKVNGTDVTSQLTTKPELNKEKTSPQAWVYKLPANRTTNANDGEYTIVVSAEDQYGKTNIVSKSTYKTTIDTTKPVWVTTKQTGMSAVPAFGAVKMNELNNGAISWFNSTSQTILGCYKEENSGIERVYYSIKPAGSDTFGAESTITASGTNEYKTFRTTLDGFAVSNSANQLKVYAVDVAGNKSAEVILSVYVDTEKPELDTIKFTNGQQINETLGSAILSNAKNPIILSGNYKDDASKVASVKLYTKKITDGVTEKLEIPADCTPDAGENVKTGKWTCILPVSGENSLESLTKSDSYTIYLKVTDNAGNESDSNKFELQIDNEPPVVSVTSPSDFAKLNGKITISGNVEENKTPLSVGVYYYFVKDGATKLLPTKINDANLHLIKKWITSDGTSTDTFIYNATVSDIYGWKINDYDLREKVSKDKGTLYLLVSSYDEAGNCNIDEASIKASDYHAYSVDPDSDRPIIKLTSLTKSGDLLKYTSTINGTVDDDDGVIKVLRISNTPFGDNPETEGSNVTINSGSFSYTPKTEADTDVTDGTVELYFYIEDSAGGKFVTNSGAGVLKMPKVCFKSGTSYTDPADNKTKISYIADSNPPLFGDIYIGTGAAGTLKEADATEKLSEFSSKIGGTVKKYVILKAEVTDTNGLKSVSVNVGGKDYVMTDADGNDVYTAVIDMNPAGADAISSGSKSITITAEDNSTITATTAPLSIMVDNDGPGISIISPRKETADPYAVADLSSKAEAEIGNVTIIGTTSDSSDLADFRYLVINDANKDSKSTKVKTGVKGYDDSEGKKPTTSWTIELADLPGDESALEGYASLVKNTVDGTELYAIPVCFYAKDELGNETILETYEFKYNPFGDRPEVALSSPEKDAVLNGSVQISGSASDNVSVSGVYLQIDANKDGKFTAADKTILEGMKDNAGKSIYKVVTGADFAAGDFSADDTQENFWGILVNGRTSWNITLNKYKEFHLDALQKGTATDAEKHNYVVKYRVAALDNNNKKSAWTESRTFTLDTNIPSVARTGSIVGYAEVSEGVKGDKRYEKAYVADMYLTSENIINELQILISDESGVQKIDYYLDESIEAVNNKKEFTTIEFTEDDKVEGAKESAKRGGAEGEKCYSKVMAKIPLTKIDGKNALAIKVVAYKNSDTETTAPGTYNVNFDNDAPTIENITFNGDVAAAYDADAVIDNSIINSNAIFTLGGKAVDEGSGFARLAFFYFRDSVKNGKRVYDPLVAPTKSGTSTVYGSEIVVEKTGVTPAATMEVAGNTMYGSKQDVTVAADAKGNLVKLTLTTDDAHIKAGGIAFVDGAWLRIASKTGKNITLDVLTPAAKSGTVENAFFPYVQVIDNTGTEKASWVDDKNDPQFSNNSDDGDGMPESVIKSQTNYNFDATIRSNFIPDGPGYMYVFAFDKAGNITSACYKATVQNNAPRLTKLWLGTALSSTPTAEEFTTYDILGTVGEKSSYVMNTAAYNNKKRFRVLGELGIAAEFVGGNNVSYDKDEDGTYTKGIGLAFNNSPEVTEKSVVKATDGSNWFAADTELSESAVLVKNDEAYSTWAYRIPVDKLGSDSGSSADSEGYEKRSMSFTFWDNTTDTTQGKDSCYCYLKIDDFIVLVEDKQAPNAVINPFYWINESENSLYANSSANGHIELAADVIADSAMDRLYGKDDPKVSGKISIRGQAYDEHVLGSIWIHMDDFVPSTKVTGDTDVEALTVGTGAASVTYYKVAEYKSTGDWEVAAGAVNDDDWNFTVTPISKGQQGHLVDWQLDIDTNGLSTGYKKDANVRILVRDAAWSSATSTIHTSDSNADDAATLSGTPAKYDCTITTVPLYKMDVVPYITGIAGAKDRSKLGRYPITTTTADLAISGWNFGAGGKIVRTTSANEDKADDLGSVENTGDTNISLECPSKSGYVSIVWKNASGTIIARTINNINSDAKYNVENGSKEELVKGKNYWTDDRYLTVWKVGSVMPHRGDKYVGYPYSGTIETLQSDGLIATSNGSGNLQTAGTVYGFWGTDGYTAEVGILGDAQSYKGISANDGHVFMSAPTYSDSCLVRNGPKTTVAGQKVANTPFYVMLDNSFQSGAVQSGLMVGRDRATLFESRSGGIDGCSIDFHSMNNQFVNPKIAGVYDKDTSTGISQAEKGTFHMYVSYFDVKNNVLKYAAYQYAADASLDSTKKAKFIVTSKLSGNDAIVSSTAGNWSDVKVDAYDSEKKSLDYTKPIPVIVYYNANAKCLNIARGTGAAPGSGTDSWKITANVKPSEAGDFGRYVSIEMDDKGGLHIAAQDVDNGVLYYGYAAGVETSGMYDVDKIEWTVVDNTSAVGRWTDIKLENYSVSGNAAKPVITYMDQTYLNTNKAVKIAYLVDAETGKWDAMTDPAVYEADDEKLSISLNATDADGGINLYAIGINSNELAVDFMRGE